MEEKRKIVTENSAHAPLRKLQPQSATPLSSGRDSPKMPWGPPPPPPRRPTWQHRWRSSAWETARRISSNAASSQGMASGPWLANPYSSSARERRRRKTGWLRCVAGTTYLRHPPPTSTATWPSGTSGGGAAAGDEAAWAAFLRQRRSICRIVTMRRILLELPKSDDIPSLLPFLSFFPGKRREARERVRVSGGRERGGARKASSSGLGGGGDGSVRERENCLPGERIELGRNLYKANGLVSATGLGDNYGKTEVRFSLGKFHKKDSKCFHFLE